jgi:cysteine desulfurase
VNFDHNATTPVAPEVREAMSEALLLGGNPSSVHSLGRRAREAVEAARHWVARLVGADPEGVVFTSGGTESDLLGVVGAARMRRSKEPTRRVVVTSRMEHPAVLGAAATLEAEGFEVRWARPSSSGVVEVEEVAQLLDETVALVSLQLVNHELGTVQPIEELARRAKRAGSLVHSDAVQAAGKLPLAQERLAVDLLSVSAHKLYGPSGVGALIVERGLTVSPLVGGGRQERGRRPGTENLAGIVGFGCAARLAIERLEQDRVSVEALTARLEAGLLGMGARLLGAGAPRVGNTVCAAFPGCPGELVVESLDLEGFAVSQGAACSSGVRAPSSVLLALGLTRAEAAEGVRLSLGRGNSLDEVERLLALLPALVSRIRRAVAD